MSDSGNLEIGSDQLFFRIGQVCRLTDTKPFTLRYWENEFPSLQPVKSSKGHRLYRREDVQTVLRIKRLLYDEGFTIAGARRYLRDAGAAQQEAVSQAAWREAGEEAQDDVAPDRTRSGTPSAEIRPGLRADQPDEFSAGRGDAPGATASAMANTTESRETLPGGRRATADHSEPRAEARANATASLNKDAHAAQQRDASASRGMNASASHSQDAPASRHDAIASPRTDAASLLSRKLLLDLRDSLRAFLTLLENE